KTGQLAGYVVCPRYQALDSIGTGFICDPVHDDAGCGVGCANRNARQDGACCVCDRSTQRRISDLTKRARDEKTRHEHPVNNLLHVFPPHTSASVSLLPTVLNWYSFKRRLSRGVIQSSPRSSVNAHAEKVRAEAAGRVGRWRGNP